MAYLNVTVPSYVYSKPELRALTVPLSKSGDSYPGRDPGGPHSVGPFSRSQQMIGTDTYRRRVSGSGPGFGWRSPSMHDGSSHCQWLVVTQ